MNVISVHHLLIAVGVKSPSNVSLHIWKNPLVQEAVSMAGYFSRTLVNQR